MDKALLSAEKCAMLTQQFMADLWHPAAAIFRVALWQTACMESYRTAGQHESPTFTLIARRNASYRHDVTSVERAKE